MKVILDVRSHSHTLNVNCFAFFERHTGATSLHVTRTSDTTLSIAIDADAFEKLGSKNVFYHCHWSASCFLVALNMATLGYFCWAESPSLRPVYRVRDPSSEETESQFTLLQHTPIVFPEIHELTENDVESVFIMFGALSQDDDSNSRIEYIKGLLHISASHVDITFYREAFGNFYRCMEGFVTKHVLQVKQLSNEVKDIQRALRKLGADEILQAAFKEIYTTRSTQFAHAQKRQVPITFDDVLKAKAMADFVMCKTYRKQAEEWRASCEA